MTPQEWERIRTKRELRIEVATQSLGLFAHLYFPHYITSLTPAFHWELYRLLQNEGPKVLEICGFRGSGKSTISAVIYPIWLAVTGRRSFIILLSDTYGQAKIHVANLIHELRDNRLLLEDFGPFRTHESVWTATDVVLKNGARIASRSRGQRIRGMRHREHRPDLLIADDVENDEVVRTEEQRAKTEQWLLSEALPTLDIHGGRALLIGNLLHDDGIIARMRRKIEADPTIGAYREYPAINDDGVPLWPERFGVDVLEQERQRVGDRYFLREYRLKLVPSSGAVVQSVQYYRAIPEGVTVRKVGIGVDLAISEKATADNTAINVLAYCSDGNYYNVDATAGHWSFATTLEQVNNAYVRAKNRFPGAAIFVAVEDVGYQRSAIQELRTRYHLPVTPVKVTTDKRARLQSVEPYLTSGQVKFRQDEDALTVREILDFGVEAHDDRCDAFGYSLAVILNSARPDITFG